MKKSWERHFRSFLSRSTKGSREDVLDVQHRGSYVAQPDPTRVQPIQSDDVDMQQLGRRHTLDNSPSVRSRVNPTVSDAAVRGGSQFQSVFSNRQPSTWRQEQDIHEKDNASEARTLSKSYEADSSLDQRGRRFQSYDSLENQLHRYQDLNLGSKIDRYKLLAPNQRILEGGLSKVDEINSRSNSAPFGGGAAIGPGGIATIAEMGVTNLILDSNYNRQSNRKKGGVQREIKVAFTEYHNSAVDTKSAFLGDEKSTAGGKVFAPIFEEHRLSKSYFYIIESTYFESSYLRKMCSPIKIRIDCDACRSAKTTISEISDLFAQSCSWDRNLDVWPKVFFDSSHYIFRTS